MFGPDPDEGDELPELCLLSFVPTQSVIEPQLLKFTPWHVSLRARRQIESGEISIDSLVPDTLVIFEDLLKS